MAEQIFLRRASGLRRMASGWDVFIFNVGLISVGLGVAFNGFYVPAFYPEASAGGASFWAMVLMLFAGLGFYLWAVAMPRSGGNYVFVSRVFHPALGFILSFVEVVVLLFYTAVAAALIMQMGFSSLFVHFGALTGIEALNNLGGWLATTTGTLLGGGLIIVLASSLLVVGMRVFFLAQKVAFALALVGTAALVVALWKLSPESVQASLPGAFGAHLTADHVTSIAREAGWEPGRTSLVGSLSAIGWPLLPLAGGVLSIGIGAEVQRAKRSQLAGILGAIIFAGLAFIAIGQLADSSIGRDVLGALAFNSVSAIPGGSPEIPPFLPLLVGQLSGSPVLGVLVAMGFVAWIYLWIPGMLAYSNRAFVAWSLDRVGPSWLGSVSPTRHTPVRATTMAGAIAVLFLVAYLFITELQSLVVFQMLMFVWGIALAAGAVFPWVRSHLFRQTGVEEAIPGGPIGFTVGCALGAIALFVAGVILWNDPIAAGHSSLAVWTVAGVVGIGLVLYLVAMVARRRQGIELSRAFREIPIE